MLAIIRVGQPVERLAKASAANLSAEALARLNAAPLGLRQDMDCLGTAGADPDQPQTTANQSGLGVCPVLRGWPIASLLSKLMPTRCLNMISVPFSLRWECRQIKLASHHNNYVYTGKLAGVVYFPLTAYWN